MKSQKKVKKKTSTDLLIISYFLYIFFFILNRFRLVSLAKQFGMPFMIILHNA